MPVTPDSLEETLAALEKKLGKGSIHTGSQVEDVYRLPFKSPTLNYATEGGIPFGRFTQMWGTKGGHKTRCAYEQIAQAQQLPHSAEKYLMPRIRYYREQDMKEKEARLVEELEFFKGKFPDGLECMLYNVEQVYDKKWAQRLGIDTDRLLLTESTTIEDIVGVMEATYPQIHMHVVDSTTNANSVEEQAMKMTDRRMGLDARVWKQCLRMSLKYWNHPNGLDNPPEDFNIGILITQASRNMRTGGEQAVSGSYFGHTSALTLRFQIGRWLWRLSDGQLHEDKPTGADKSSFAGRAEPDGRTIFMEVEKSRVGGMGRIARVQSDMRRKEFDTIWEFCQAAIHFGVAVQAGSVYKIEGDDKSVKGMKGLRARIKADPELQDKIYAILMESTYEIVDEEDLEEAA